MVATTWCLTKIICCGNVTVMTRRTILDSALIDKLTGLIREGHFIKHACAGCSISEAAIYKWLQQGDKDIGNGIESEDSIYVSLVESIKKAEFDLLSDAYTKIKSMSTERKSWEAWFRFLESRFPQYFRREMTVIHDDEMAERRYQELLVALRQPKIEALSETLALSEAKP